MAVHHNHELPPGQMKAYSEVIRVACETHGLFKNDDDMVQYIKPLLEAQNKALRQEFYMTHTYNINIDRTSMETNTPPTVPPHTSHGGQPTTIGPSQSNDPTIILDQATRQFINIKPPGSTEWQGMCALNCQQTINFISVEAMRRRRLPVKNGGQYECAWEVDGVTRIGIFKAVSHLGADVAFGVDWLDDCPTPATAVSIETTPHSPSNPLAGTDIATDQRSKPSGQLSTDDHAARPESQGGYGNTRHQKQKHQGAPRRQRGHMRWLILGRRWFSALRKQEPRDKVQH
ncbi:unnamed protein product [Clonostachys solani]|uniref:Uncharacterized protein n=1 Tax=Clonostachys solani TaxID=160281 RepID=A0A9N9YUP6_9HYPO|nr:unnamed protein product [Clonostachys solani]